MVLVSGLETSGMALGVSKLAEYLAIKNWEEFQGSYTRSYIRDYTTQGSDEDYCKLTFFQRHVLQELRRIRGRIGKNVPYDLHYICRESAASIPDKPRINAALIRLIHDGWLFVTDQQHSEPNTPIKRREKSKREEKKPSPQKPAEVLPQDSWHTRIKSMIQTAWSEHNQNAECPWGPADAKQLKLVRGRSPKWHDIQYFQCLVNMYASEGFPRSKLPFEFLPRLCSYLSGPRNEFNREKNGNGYINKSQQRQDASNDAIKTALKRMVRQDSGESEIGIPLLGHDAGNSGDLLAGNGLPGVRSRAASAGGGDTEIIARVQDVPISGRD